MESKCTIQEKEKAARCAYHNNCYIESEQYVLVFDNGSVAMPGITLR